MLLRFGVTIELPLGNTKRASESPTQRLDTIELLNQGPKSLTFFVRKMNLILFKPVFVGYFITCSQKNS